MIMQKIITDKKTLAGIMCLLLIFWAGSATAGDKPTTQLYDKFEIGELINSWGFYRDQGRWDELLDTFHEDGTISISWFNGPHKKFVEISSQMAKEDTSVLKHHIGTPMISVNGSRAVSEANVTILVRAKTPKGDIDNASYARFYDFLEKRNGKWKILKRVGIYEKDRLDPVKQPYLEEMFFKGLEEFPPQLQFLGGALKKVGKTILPSVIIDKSNAMENLYKEGKLWLSVQ
jgi:hypothetical protein